MLAEAVQCYQLAATLEPQKHEWAASYAAASEELMMQRWLPRRVPVVYVLQVLTLLALPVHTYKS